MIRRLTFLIGLCVGLGGTALAGAAILTYLLTGKLPAVEMGETGQGPRPTFALLSPDEVMAVVKQRAAKGGSQAEQGSSGLEQEVGDAG
ncbi:MAG: hypothetical protein JSV36_14300 [Anaerolineae bacterium]|nr:MAG: hypothetical protein JSV36_14300 [Anaerolineae bacterium]